MKNITITDVSHEKELAELGLGVRTSYNVREKLEMQLALSRSTVTITAESWYHYDIDGSRPHDKEECPLSVTIDIDDEDGKSNQPSELMSITGLKKAGFEIRHADFRKTFADSKIMDRFAAEIKATFGILKKVFFLLPTSQNNGHRGEPVVAGRTARRRAARSRSVYVPKLSCA